MSKSIRSILSIILVLCISFSLSSCTLIAKRLAEEGVEFIEKTKADADLEPEDEPISGKVLSGVNNADGSMLTITAPNNESCVVKLKTSYGSTRMSFYVRAGDTVTVGVPAEPLYAYFACGKTWYGKEDLFGEYTSYSKDDELLDFTQYTFEYTLYPVTSGNFSETPIDEDEFKD